MTVVFRQEGGGDFYLIPAIVGENVLRAANRAGVVIDAPCSGSGTCGKCRVKIISGTADSLENIHLSKEDFDAGWRLACQSTISSDVELLVPAEASAFKSGIRTSGLSGEAELHRYNSAISAIFETGLPRSVRQIGVGLAVDIGTTTVSAALIDLSSGAVLSAASVGNGQMQYGADVINRIIQSAKPGGKERLLHAIREDTILPLIERLCQGLSIKPQDISRAVIVGNTTMEHLFIGAQAESIRFEPYVPAFLELMGQTGDSTGLPIEKDAPVVFAPNVGSYVGGDITAGVFSTMMWDSDDMTLFIDLGTNGELVLGDRSFMLCCACSAGPAFEGGDISCGMRAIPGAVQAVKIDQTTMEPSFEIIGDSPLSAQSKITQNPYLPAGLCGSGLIDTVSELFRCGIINARGKIIRDGRRVKRGEYESSYVLAFSDESAHGRDIELSETDIDNFIRAKAAVFSAVMTLLRSLDMSIEDIDRILIAGGIGGGIDMANSISIGMLPAAAKDKYSYVGNSALTGACAMLQSDAVEQRVYEIGRNMTYLELSSCPGYMDEFVAACFLPHTDAELFERK